MPNKELDLDKVAKLGHGEHTHIGWFDGGGGEVHRIWNALVLFEIPQYGGEGRYTQTFHESEAAAVVDLVYSWT